MVLFYDLYVDSILYKRDALIVKHFYEKNDSLYSVEIIADTFRLRFFEKNTPLGLQRSIDGSLFNLTHSFMNNRRIESLDWKINSPFINNWITKAAERKYFLGNDAFVVYFFDESYYYYSITTSCFSKELNVFLLYDLPTKNKYYKISRVEGLNLEKEKRIIEVSQKIINDTFFHNYYNLPALPPP